jgi:hypothetical protein
MKHKCYEWKGQPAVYAHLKLDGHYVMASGTDSGSIVISSGGHVVDGFQGPALPHGMEVLGELWAPFRPASAVPTAIRDGSARFTAFAIATEPKTAPLEALEAILEPLGVEFAQFIVLQSGWSPEALLDTAKAAGQEGYVLKDGNLLNWRKLKVQQTLDAVVTGWTDGRGKYAGLVGSLVCSVYASDVDSLIEIANVGGMSDAERILMSDDPDAVLGRVVEVEYQYVGACGRLRHPRFVRWRDDKQPHECRKDQL